MISTERIRAALTPELLKEPYRSKVLRGECSPLTGHCYVSAEAYFHLHGGKAAGLKPMSIQHEGGPHWWIRDAQGRDIDLTAEQFATPVPYEKGVGKGFLTKEPSKRAAIVMARAQAAQAQENPMNRTNPKRRTALTWEKPSATGSVHAHTKDYSYHISPREPRGYEVRQSHVHDYGAHVVTLGWVKTLAGAKALAEKAYTKRMHKRGASGAGWGTRQEREYHEQQERQERAYREDTRWNPSLGQVWSSVKRAVQGPPSPYAVGDRVRFSASGTAPDEKATWGQVRRTRRGESADGWQVYVEWPAAYGPAGWERGDDVTRLPPKGALRPRSNPGVGVVHARAHRIDTVAHEDQRTGKRADAQAALRRIAKANEMGFYLDHRGWYQQGIDSHLIETLSRGRGAMRKASVHRDYLARSDAARLNAFVAGTGRL